jgi:hypothetical protein
MGTVKEELQTKIVQQLITRGRTRDSFRKIGKALKGN